MPKMVEEFVIDNNIEVVVGAKNSCLINLNTGKTYSVDSAFLELFKQIRNGLIAFIPKTLLAMLVSEFIIVKQSDKSPKFNSLLPDQRLRFAWIEVTKRCNLKCIHCYEESVNGSETEDMSLPDFFGIIDALKTLEIRRIQLIGGEPFLNSKIVEMINFCSGKFEYIEIFTNGTLLTEHLLHIIKAANIHLAVSVFAASSDIHDGVTQVCGSYSLTNKSIVKITKHRVPLRVASVEMKDVPLFTLFDEQIKQKIDLPRLTGRATLELYSKPMLRKKLITQESFKRPVDPEHYYRNTKLHNCFADKIYIDIRGNVFPCVMERRLAHNNLLKYQAGDILKQEICSLSKDLIVGCCDCEFRFICFDCRPDANGQGINSKPWYCTYNPYQGKWENVENYIDGILGMGGETNGRPTPTNADLEV